MALSNDIQGYGHIGREVARLLRAFNVEVIVANSDGRARIDQGVRWSHGVYSSSIDSH
jgi:phosphoglycerate dehydrogenase-like enzyme